MHTDTIFHLILVYKYWLLLPLAIAEGPIVAMLTGLLTSLGYFEVVPAYIVLLFGDIIPDITYYLLGRHSNVKDFVNKYASKIGLTQHRMSKIEHLWKEHTFKTMAFSKWAYGFSTPLLMSAGLVHLSFIRYLLYTVSLSMLQFAVFFSVGYYSGASYQTLSHELHYVEYALVGVLIAAIGGYTAFSLFIKKVFLRTPGNE